MIRKVAVVLLVPAFVLSTTELASRWLPDVADGTRPEPARLRSYTTGFGVGFTLVDELWFGVEFKTHRYEVNAPRGPVSSYQTYSIGPVRGYKAFSYKGLYTDMYLRYRPNVASSLADIKIALQGSAGAVTDDARDFDVFANVSIGYAFDETRIQ